MRLKAIGSTHILVLTQMNNLHGEHQYEMTQSILNVIVSLSGMDCYIYTVE